MYGQLSDLEFYIDSDTLISLTDDEGVGAVHEDRVDIALETASITIDAYLAEAGIALPLVLPSPPLLKGICCSIAGYLLHVRRDMASEIWKEKHDDAIVTLEKIATGTLSLIDDTGELDTEAAGAVRVSAPEPLFPEDLLGKM